MRTPVFILILFLAACSDDSEKSDLVISSSQDRQFHYYVYFPESVDKMPLVLFSHGSGGDYRSYKWIIEALVANGYAVAALNHPNDNALDNTNEGLIRAWDRPKDMSVLLDDLLTNSTWSEKIDLNRVGVAGHSSGGYAAIALGGAIYNPDGMKTYCGSAERGPDCNLASDPESVDYSGSSLSYKDTRINSVLAMAPAIGPAIEKGSLELISIPVLIMATRDDEVLGHKNHASYYAKHIPGSELLLLPEGGHFIFMECDIMTMVADWFIEEFELCGGQFNTDRERARLDMIPRIIEFFDSNIGAGPDIELGKRGAVNGAPS